MISIIIPFYNEKENLAILYAKLREALEGLKYELIFVDDGSNDRSHKKITSFLKDTIKLIRHRKQSGKGKALESGFSLSKGEVIVFIDADLQNDPKDIPLLIQKLKTGYEFVNGWRRHREDQVSKTIPSSIFNRLLLKLFLGSTFHDINCGLKVMRREVLETIPLYGDNYRFLAVFAEKEGFKTTELEVAHHPRIYGVSKYGTTRLFFGTIDILTTYFIQSFSEKPLHFFGTIGGFFFLIGSAVMIVLLSQRIVMGMLLYRRPAFLFAILFIIIGIQILMTGILGELIVYMHKKTRTQTYHPLS